MTETIWSVKVVYLDGVPNESSIQNGLCIFVFMADTKITTLLFDLGNVLFDLNIPATERALARVLGERTTEFRSWTIHNHFFERYEIGEISDSDFVGQINQYCLPGTKNEEIISAWNAMLVGMPLERLTWLKELRKTYRVALLSNTNALHIKWVHHYLEQKYQITQFEEDCFDRVYYSHEIRARKPDAAAFRYVLENLGVNPEEVLFIDDVKENYLGAKTVDIVAIQHSPNFKIETMLPAYLNRAYIES